MKYDLENALKRGAFFYITLAFLTFAFSSCADIMSGAKKSGENLTVVLPALADAGVSASSVDFPQNFSRAASLSNFHDTGFSYYALLLKKGTRTDNFVHILTELKNADSKWKTIIEEGMFSDAGILSVDDFFTSDIVLQCKSFNGVSLTKNYTVTFDPIDSQEFTVAVLLVYEDIQKEYDPILLDEGKFLEMDNAYTYVHYVVFCGAELDSSMRISDVNAEGAGAGTPKYGPPSAKYYSSETTSEVSLTLKRCPAPLEFVSESSATSRTADNAYMSTPASPYKMLDPIAPLIGNFNDHETVVLLSDITVLPIFPADDNYYYIFASGVGENTVTNESGDISLESLGFRNVNTAGMFSKYFHGGLILGGNVSIKNMNEMTMVEEGTTPFVIAWPLKKNPVFQTFPITNDVVGKFSDSSGTPIAEMQPFVLVANPSDTKDYASYFGNIVDETGQSYALTPYNNGDKRGYLLKPQDTTP